jgi:hypothetical protein
MSILMDIGLTVLQIFWLGRAFIRGKKMSIEIDIGLVVLHNLNTCWASGGYGFSI